MKLLEFIQNNSGTLIVLAILAAIVAAVILVMIRDKKKGKCSCGCGCGSCPMSGKCHGTQNDTPEQ